MSYGGKLVPRDSRSCRLGRFGSFTAWVPTRCRTTAATATSGAVNRPGKNAPAVNPTTQMVTSATTPTATGHSGGPPQVTPARDLDIQPGDRDQERQHH